MMTNPTEGLSAAEIARYDQAWQSGYDALVTLVLHYLINCVKCDELGIPEAVTVSTMIKELEDLTVTQAAQILGTAVAVIARNHHMALAAGETASVELNASLIKLLESLDE